MIGAIKRRWKSTKKAKVLHKGGELSTSNDICPTSRGFALVDSTTDEFSDKMIKPPSPRQIHPVLEKGGCVDGVGVGGGKYGGQLPPLPPNVTGGRKSLSGIDEGRASSPPPLLCQNYVHVNSGRIELVSSRFSKEHNENKLIWRNRPHLIKGGGKGNANDARHSWCGSVFRGGMDVSHPRKAIEERNSQHYQYQNQNQNQPQLPSQPPPLHQNTLTMTATLLNPLRERLTAIEDLTKGLQTQQTNHKLDFQQCLSELVVQVSKAVAIHQMMKSEVEKLHSRMVSLENHNKAMTTMIIPTLMKLQETIMVKQSLVKKLPEQKILSSKPREEERCKSPNQRKNNATSFSSTKRSIQSGMKIKCLPQKLPNECRIPRMSDGRLNRSSDNNNEAKLPPSSNNNNKSSSGININKSKSELISNNNQDNLSSLSQSSSSNESKKLFGRIPRKTRNSSIVAAELSPSNANSKLPVRKSLSGITPLKHPSASSKSLPNHASTFAKPNLENLIGNNNNNRNLRSTFGYRQKVSGIPVQKSSLHTKLGSGGKVGGGKDEGYSTMSSEALVDQDPNKLQNGAKDENSVLKETKEEQIIIVPQKERKTSIQKSNTFNTFREIGCPISIRNKVVIPAASSPIKMVQGMTTTTTVATVSILEPASITRTTDNVRILRGRPFDIHFDDSTNNTTETSSSTTVLWEDSDDSDILFLPIEMSSEESGGCDSESTLIPTSYASWTMSSGSGDNATPTPTPKNSDQNELIEKWMRLEDVRNETQWDEEWAWDWDGVERTTPQKGGSHRIPLTPPNIIISGVVEEDESDLGEEEFWFASQRQKQQESSLNDAHEGCSQIDSSTWTKSKCNKMKKLLLEQDGQRQDGKSVDLEDGSLISQNELEGEDEMTPPVVEFTREFYRLANYGSNLSFSESPAGRRGRSSPTGHSSDGGSVMVVNVDDKIIQTDFTNNSSLENLSVSSDLFAECRNCLEIMKKLVGHTSESRTSSDMDIAEGMMNLSEFERRLAELSADVGCSSPTTWVSVPKGVTSTEVDKILEILSSSESEDVLSPAK